MILFYNSEVASAIRPTMEKSSYEYVTLKRLLTTGNIGNTLNFMHTTQKTGLTAPSVVLPFLTMALFTQGLIQKKTNNLKLRV